MLNKQKCMYLDVHNVHPLEKNISTKSALSHHELLPKSISLRYNYHTSRSNKQHHQLRSSEL